MMGVMLFHSAGLSYGVFLGVSLGSNTNQPKVGLGVCQMLPFTVIRIKKRHRNRMTAL